MKIKSILFTVAIIASTVFTGFIVGQPVLAAQCGDEPYDETTQACCGEEIYNKSTQGCCNDIVTETVNIDCAEGGNGISALILLVINILTAAVGVAAVGGIIWGSILYTTAAGSPEKTKKGIMIITDVVIGLIAFAGMWALLNFIVPGGAFKSVPTI